MLIITVEIGDVDAILIRLGLDQFRKVFRDNYIDLEAFKELNDSDMADLKLPIGAKSKIRREISRIQSEENAGTIYKL